MTVAPWIIEAHKSGAWLDTRGGGKRRVVCVDAPGQFPVICIDEFGGIFKQRANGTWTSTMDHCDLIPPRRKWEVCILEKNFGMPKFVMPSEAKWYEHHGWKLLARATITEGDGAGRSHEQ